MRLLHLTDRLSSRGGAHRHLLGVLEWLAQQGHDVHLAVGLDEGARAPGAVHQVPGLESREGASVDLARLVERVRPDVVHVHTVVNPVALEWAGSQRAVMTVQDHRYFCPARGKWTREGQVCREVMSASACEACFEDRGYFEEVLALTRRRLEAIRKLTTIVLSRYMKKEMVEAGAPEARVHVVPPFVHGLDSNARADGPPCVLFAGRLVEHKGVRDVIEAWRRSRVDLPLVVAGTGPLREELVAAGAQVLGWLDPPALSRVYRRARALLLPSRWQEPFGIAGLEALTMGVPVVAWESGGVAEWHPGPLTPWGDVDALAAGLRDAIARPVAEPRGVEREALMSRLLALYRDAAG